MTRATATTEPRNPRTPVWGAKSIAPIVGRTPKQVYYLASKKLIPGVKAIGEQLVYDPDHVLGA